jgi:hypothetical protein
MIDRFKLQGVFTATCRRPDGTIRWEEKTKNLVVNEGLDHALGVLFNGDTPVSPWYVTLFESNTTILATHTYAVPGFTECTAYDEATRPEYVEAAPSGQSLTNSANRAVFTISATKTIYGAALVSVSTKGDVAGGGVLWCAAQFTNAKICEDDDTIEVTYTLTSADDGV